MDADLQPLGRCTLHHAREIVTATLPEPVLDAPGLERHKALVVQERRQQRRDRGIVLDNALQIEACGLDEFGRGGKRLFRDGREARALVVISAKPLPDLEGERAGEIVMIENGFRQRRREHGIGANDRFRFAPGRLPEFCCRGHVALPAVPGNVGWVERQRNPSWSPKKQTARLLSQTGGSLPSGLWGHYA